MSIMHTGRPASRLRRLAPDLWVDVDDIVVVRTYTAKSTYHRMVEVQLRSGALYKILAVRHSPMTHARIGDLDDLLAEWLSVHLGDVIGS